MEADKNFGEFLRDKRKAQDFTLRGLAEKLDCSAPYLLDIEKGRRNPPSLERLRRIAKILCLSEEDKALMFDLAGKEIKAVPPDMAEYIMANWYVGAAIRIAMDSDLGEQEWLKLMRSMRISKPTCTWTKYPIS